MTPLGALEADFNALSHPAPVTRPPGLRFETRWSSFAVNHDLAIEYSVALIEGFFGGELQR